MLEDTLFQSLTLYPSPPPLLHLHLEEEGDIFRVVQVMFETDMCGGQSQDNEGHKEASLVK